MKEKIISGIQQIGIGVPNMKEAWKWYKEKFGFDVRVFEEAAIANYMLPYTGGQPQKRHAALALNLQGGGGFEIWQYVDRTPLAPAFQIQLGDLGIFAGKIKCHDAALTHDFLKIKGCGNAYQHITRSARQRAFLCERPIWKRFPAGYKHHLVQK